MRMWGRQDEDTCAYTCSASERMASAGYKMSIRCLFSRNYPGTFALLYVVVNSSSISNTIGATMFGHYVKFSMTSTFGLEELAARSRQPCCPQDRPPATWRNDSYLPSDLGLCHFRIPNKHSQAAATSLRILLYTPQYLSKFGESSF